MNHKYAINLLAELKGLVKMLHRTHDPKVIARLRTTRESGQPTCEEVLDFAADYELTLNLSRYKKAINAARIYSVSNETYLKAFAYHAKLVGVREVEDLDTLENDVGLNYSPSLPFPSVLIVASECYEDGDREMSFLVTESDLWAICVTDDNYPYHEPKAIVIDGVPRASTEEEIQVSKGAILMAMGLSKLLANASKTRSLSIDRARAQASKKQRVDLPNDYYVVHYVETNSSESNGGTHASPAHCYDVAKSEVSGWSAYRLIRGLLPIDPVYESRLRKRADRIIVKSPADVPPELAEVLKRRGVTLQEGEWLSACPYTVEDFEREAHQRNKGKPYVPALRVK